MRCGPGKKTHTCTRPERSLQLRTLCAHSAACRCSRASTSSKTALKLPSVPTTTSEKPGVSISLTSSVCSGAPASTGVIDHRIIFCCRVARSASRRPSLDRRHRPPHHLLLPRRTQRFKARLKRLRVVVLAHIAQGLLLRFDVLDAALERLHLL